jgi:hypothetical protein
LATVADIYAKCAPPKIGERVAPPRPDDVGGDRVGDEGPSVLRQDFAAALPSQYRQ